MANRKIKGAVALAAFSMTLAPALRAAAVIGAEIRGNGPVAPAAAGRMAAVIGVYFGAPNADASSIRQAVTTLNELKASQNDPDVRAGLRPVTLQIEAVAAQIASAPSADVSRKKKDVR